MCERSRLGRLDEADVGEACGHGEATRERRRLRLHGGASAAASAMAGRGEGGEQGGSEVSGSSGRHRGGPSRRRRAVQATQASRELRGELRRACAVPLCLLAEVGGDWHQARWAGPVQVSGLGPLSLSLF